MDFVAELGSFCTRAGVAGEDAPEVTLNSFDLGFQNDNAPWHFDAHTGRMRSLDAVYSHLQRALRLCARKFRQGEGAAAAAGGGAGGNVGVVTEHEGIDETNGGDNGDMGDSDMKGHRLVLAEPCGLARETREGLCEMVFEHGGCDGYFPAPDALLSLYSSGRSTGCVLSVGYHRSHAVCFDKGDMVLSSAHESCVGGFTLLDFMQREYGLSYENALSLIHRDNHIDSLVDRDGRGNRPTFLRVQDGLGSLLFEEESAAVEERMELPDGNVVYVDPTAGPDIYFDCDVRPKNCKGSIATVVGRATTEKALPAEPLQRLVEQSISRAREAEVQGRDLMQNMVLTGAGSMLNGFAPRLNNELVSVLDQWGRNVGVISHPERFYSAWVGGSIVGSLESFEDMFFCRAQYEEEGAAGLEKNATECSGTFLRDPSFYPEPTPDELASTETLCGFSDPWGRGDVFTKSASKR